MRAEERSTPGPILIGAIVVGLLLAGWVVGRSGCGASEPSLPAAGARLSAQMRDGVPVGFPRTPAGAAQAVAAYQDAFASPGILKPGILRKRIEAVATPEYAATMIEASSPGLERLAAGPIGAGVADGLQTLYAAVPIGYRVESFAPERARILTWGFTLLGNATDVEPAAYFGLTRTELAWTVDGWRIAETRGGFGPSPKLATEPGPLESYDVIGLATGLKSYELAP